MSGLFHAVVLYSLTKLPQISQKEEEYIRIDLSRIAFLKDEKTQAPPKEASKKSESKKSQPKEIREKKPAEKQVVSTALLEDKAKKLPSEESKKVVENDTQEAQKATKLAEVKAEREFTGKAQRIGENAPEGSFKAVKKESGGESLAYSKPEPREDYEETYKKLNLSEIRKLIQESLVYPPIARKMGWEGKVSVEVVLTPEGCEGVSLKEKTGYEVLDKNALETVKKLCNRFPKPQKKVVLLIPIVYKLN